MPAFIDLTGRRFGRLTVQERAQTIAGRTRWSCVCDCGNRTVVRQDHLGDDHVRSCGCLHADYMATGELAEASTTHGMSGTPEYKAFKSAQDRCQNPRHVRWHGRGIEFRFRSFEQFYAEVGKKPSRAHSIERIDNDGHYEPGNVKWATAKEQALNTRRNLKDWQVRTIRDRYAYGDGVKWLAFVFQVSRSHIYQIVRGKARREAGGCIPDGE